jgi:hypothetical protein
MPWVVLDLGAASDVRSVKLWNRHGCCQERLGSHTVHLSIDGRAWKQCSASKAPATDGPFEERCVGAGRYVKIKLETNNFLNLAEVKVLGAAVESGTVLQLSGYRPPAQADNGVAAARAATGHASDDMCLGMPFFKTKYADGENPYFGAKNFTAIGLFLTAFRDASLAAGSVPMLAAGSLLGWRRHCSIMVHDGDIDLHVFADGFDLDVFDASFHKAAAAAGLLDADKNYCFGSSSMVRKIGEFHYQVCVHDEAHTLGVVHVDVYMLKRAATMPNWLWFNQGEHLWGRLKSQWFRDIRMVKLHGAEIGVPATAATDAYLRWTYGVSWDKMMQEHDHGGDMKKKWMWSDDGTDPDWTSMGDEGGAKTKTAKKSE